MQPYDDDVVTNKMINIFIGIGLGIMTGFVIQYLLTR